ncbi:MAG: AIR synthase-related protein [Candidatus Aenigmarchaeota archaeon]|nr:AIR synthase-related protein [Candidatus Aenigmarchaeota archaeon]
MPSQAHRIEASIKPGFRDPLGERMKKTIVEELGIPVEEVRTVRTHYIEGNFGPRDLDFLARELFSDKIVENVSVNRPVGLDSDWLVEVGPVPGSKDSVGDAATRTINGLPGKRYKCKAHATTIYGIKGDLSPEQVERIAREKLIYSTEIDRYKVTKNRRRLGKDDYLGAPVIPEEQLRHKPMIELYDLSSMSDDELLKLSVKRRISLNKEEMKEIARYLLRDEDRKELGLQGKATDGELEIAGQSWSEHCKHKIFNAKVRYTDGRGKTKEIDSIFNTYLKKATLELKEKLPWVKSVLWDNSGVIEFNDKYLLCIKLETHNSPSKVHPYGGAITGIVGVFRDPKGTGKGGKLIFGVYGFLTGDPEYDGELLSEIHPGKMWEGIRVGVEKGGNPHGVPTVYGINFFDDGYMAKPVVIVGAGALIPKEVNGKPGEEKELDYGDLIVMCGGRVGIDGIHGATESSMEGGKHISLGHVQMGDPYTQRKMFDFLEDAMERGLYKFIQDNGAGGLSSSVGEAAHFRKNGGFRMDLKKVPLKYKGLDPWQILVSESQERMTVAVDSGRIKEFKKLAREYDVEASVLGEFNDSGKFHVVYGNKNVTYMDMDFVHDGVPQMELNARWKTPKQRGLREPELAKISDYGSVLKEMLARPNICSKEFINRQFDHEVQGMSVVKHLVGKESDAYSDGVVQNPDLESDEGLALGAGMNPHYMHIDTYHGAACALNDGIMRNVAVGGNPSMMFNIDNFLWPSPIPSPSNPDAEYKMAQLVRANKALHDYTLKFKVPSISGKDSMSMDDKDVKDRQGNTRRLSAQPTLQFMVGSKVPDILNSVTMDVKNPGDIVYVLGTTKDELGGSEFYRMQGAYGLNIPKVAAGKSLSLYKRLHRAMQQNLVNSCHGCYDGGLAVSAAQSAFAGGYGMDIDLGKIPMKGVSSDDRTLFSQSQGRFVVTVSPEDVESFEKTMKGECARVGNVRNDDYFRVKGLNGRYIIKEDIGELKHAWKHRYAGR